MKKQKNIIKIGEEFQENKKMTQDYWTEFKTLRECYGKWSDAKENVYNYYKNLLNNNCDSVEKYGIRSFNCNVIVLHAIVEKEGKKLYLVITPSHNWYSEI
jgi:hypothetical protein